MTVVGFGVALEVVPGRHTLAVDPQPHRCPAVIRLQDSLPIVRPVLAQGIDEPRRMIEARFLILGFCPSQILPNEIAQHRVDEPGIFGTAQDSRRLDGYRYRGMIRYARIAQLIKTDREQRLDDTVACLQRTVEQLADVCTETKVVTQCPVAQHLDQWLVGEIYTPAVLGKRAVQRSAINDNGIHDLRCLRPQARG